MAILHQSFFEKNEKKIKKVIEEPLLELVLKYLPHLQLTEKEKDNSWEAVAIELNGRMLERAIKDDKDGEESFKMDELPILNGRFVKDVYLKVYTKWKKAYVNAAMANSELFMKLYFNDTRQDYLCLELFKLRSFDVEEIASASSEKLRQRIRNHVLGANWDPEEYHEPEAENNVDFAATQADQIIEEARRSQEVSLSERIHEELTKRDKKIETLRKENMKLAELNQDLLQGQRLSN